MNPSFFVAFSLFLTALYGALHAEIIKELRSGEQEQVLISQMQRELAEERLKYKVLAGEHLSFKHEVAQALPGFLEEHGGDPEAGYPVRNLASLVISSQALDVFQSPQIVLMAKAKSSFKAENYDQAISSLTEFLSQYETSTKAIEARFLLAESYFQKKAFDESLTTINQMLTLYPENELTGFLLLRLGAILEDQHKAQEARAVYQAIPRNFQNKDLVFQAESNLQRLSL